MSMIATKATEFIAGKPERLAWIVFVHHLGCISCICRKDNLGLMLFMTLLATCLSSSFCSYEDVLHSLREHPNVNFDVKHRSLETVKKNMC